MRVFLSNLGCKLNQAETDRMARQFSAAGHEISSSLAEADLHVVNSCTVTHLAARDSRKVARRGRRLHPRLRTVLTGCYVASDPREAARLAGVDLVVANQDKAMLVERVHDAFPEPRSTIGPGEGTSGIGTLPPLGNARALVKVEDGCNMRCSFCVIPKTRGGQRSRPLDRILEEIETLAAGGHQEVVVTGVQISSYRWLDLGLADLVEILLQETSIRRLRLSSIAPWELDHRLLDLFRHHRICRHLHLSLQSGCGATLRRMRRPYTPAAFAEAVESARSAVPGIAVTTDVIAGFPGETDAEFAESLRFIDLLGFSRLHAFPFSPRPGTEAAELPDQVPHAVKRFRMEKLLEAGRHGEQRFWKAQMGQVCQVLWEERKGDRVWGTTDNYIRVWSSSPEPATRALGDARLESIDAAGVRCTPVSTGPALLRRTAGRA